MAATTYTTLQQFLTAETTGPFVSLYVPLQPRPTADKAKLLVKNLVHHAKTVMASAWPDADWAPYEAALAPLAADPALIAEVSGTGLGVLTNGAAIYLRALEYPVSETAMATARPQILPMVLDAQRHLVFDLLALQGDQIALYHNAGEVLTRTTLPSDAPLTLETTLGSELRGGALNTVSLGQDHSSYHGHNEKSAEVQTDQRRYYQAVDTYLAAHYSKKTETPLVVFGLTQNIAVFRELSRNPYLVRDQQIERSPSDLNLTAIDDILTPLRQAHATRQQEALLQTVDEARGNGTYDEDLGSSWMRSSLCLGAADHPPRGAHQRPPVAGQHDRYHQRSGQTQQPAQRSGGVDHRARGSGQRAGSRAPHPAGGGGAALRGGHHGVNHAATTKMSPSGRCPSWRHFFMLPSKRNVFIQCRSLRIMKLPLLSFLNRCMLSTIGREFIVHWATRPPYKLKSQHLRAKWPPDLMLSMIQISY
ncbi:hypothetical protein [Lacticaseibacillus paracasei]|uniref:baeRF6 domain-containing protein n=1 Tax=Lacticaseibacillus paracasei TaxID=1597 RepID=UPI002010F7EB|nr:hypothetical protein [Lacticaseibacillus paracasei]